MLGMVTGAVLRGEIPNARIVPVTLNYEKVLEIDAIVTEQMGNPKKMESFSGAVTGGIRTLKQNFGSVKVCFGEEISIQRFRKTLVRYQVQSMAIYNSPFFLTSACLYRSRYVHGFGHDLQAAEKASEDFDPVNSLQDHQAFDRALAFHVIKHIHKELEVSPTGAFPYNP